MFSSLLENIQLYYEDSDPLVRPFQSISKSMTISIYNVLLLKIYLDLELHLIH